MRQHPQHTSQEQEQINTLRMEIKQLKDQLTSLQYQEHDSIKAEGKNQIEKVSFAELPQGFEWENFQEVLTLFKKNCKAKKTRKLYKNLCRKAYNISDAKHFVLNHFQPYKLIDQKTGSDVGKLTGYYVASINASLKKSSKYRYPLYAKPQDLVSVELSSIYPELRHYRLRGRVQGDRLVPYYPRAQEGIIDAPVLCYCDSKIDRFFLEVQGSGVVHLDDNTTMYVGYADQNGHRYRSIGRYLVRHNYMHLEDVSMESIKKWLRKHPDKIDEVLNYNRSMVFFRKKPPHIYGSLGVELSPMRSVAVDRRYIPLGSMLYLHAAMPDQNISKIVFAQDTGGAIKGGVRADLFAGEGSEAELVAGSLNAPLKLWLFLPKGKDE